MCIAGEGMCDSSSCRERSIGGGRCVCVCVCLLGSMVVEICSEMVPVESVVLCVFVMMVMSVSGLACVTWNGYSTAGPSWEVFTERSDVSEERVNVCEADLSCR